MKIIIFGGAGYLGGTLAPLLLAQNHQVTVFDTLYFGEAALEPLKNNPNFTFILGDMTNIQQVYQALKGQEAAVILAALVGEPACDRDPDLTVAINYLGSLNLMRAARYLQVSRVIFASTDSCYGAQEGVLLTEDSPLLPISLYAELKVRVEEEFFRLYGAKEDSLCPTILRLATLYGLAKIFSGEQWRPLVHVRDAALAFSLALTAPPEVVGRQIFNVGSNEQNIQFKDLGQLLQQSVPQANIQTIPQPPDLRDYRVLFDKIQKSLGFKATLKPQDGIMEIKEALESQKLKDPYDPIYQNG